MLQLLFWLVSSMWFWFIYILFVFLFAVGFYSLVDDAVVILNKGFQAKATTQSRFSKVQLSWNLFEEQSMKYFLEICLQSWLVRRHDTSSVKSSRWMLSVLDHDEAWYESHGELSVRVAMNIVLLIMSSDSINNSFYYSQSMRLLYQIPAGWRYQGWILLQEYHHVLGITIIQTT